MYSGAEVPNQDNNTSEGTTQKSDAVWTFRGYRLSPGDFTTAMVHFFRAEVARANVWRQRLDATTNWAVITTGAVISIAFAQGGSNHFVILLNLILVTIFLLIEARRYRYYELWSYRVRLMETDFFAEMLVPPFRPSADWAEALAENLLQPNFTISIWEAVGRRLRRNYLWIYLVIIGAWIANLWFNPQSAASFQDLSQRADVGSIQGVWIILIVLLFLLLMSAIAIGTVGMQSSTGEILPRFAEDSRVFSPEIKTTGVTDTLKRAWFRTSRRRAQLLTFIITEKKEAITQRIIKDMGRGITGLEGQGMYTGKAQNVLMCALTVTEVPQLKALVAEEDADAFVVVAPATEIFGHGFIPLKDKNKDL